MACASEVKSSVQPAMITPASDLPSCVSDSRYVPTLDDVEMYKSHKGPVADLHIVDQYMLEVSFRGAAGQPS